MKETILEVIASGVYNLMDLLRKIDVLWLQSSITDDERQELIVAAQENANPEYSYSDAQYQLNQVFERLGVLETDMVAVKKAIEQLGGSTTDPEPGEEWPDWYAWDGTGKCPWQRDSKCTHNARRWLSQVDKNIWEPGAPGVHDTIWKEAVE